MKKSVLFELLFCMTLCISSCSKNTFLKTYSTKSESGENVLSFSFNGEFIHQISQEGGIYAFLLAPTTRYAKYYDSMEDNTKNVYAILGNLDPNTQRDLFSEILLVLPLDGIYEGAELRPGIELTYLYLPRIWHWENEQDAKVGVIDRLEEYRKMTIEHSTLTIRKWDEKRKILAGDFSMRGFYTDSTETVIPFDVQDGLFDVTDSYSPLNY